jgi:competence protein ComEA
LNLRERLPFITVVALSIALVIGLVELLPHLNCDNLVLTLEPTEQPADTSLPVHIEGDVPYPGIYELDRGSTIGDALQRAGCNDYSQPLRLAVGDGDSTRSAQRVNLNSADAWLLEALPGIGHTRAEAIVLYRNTHGPFAYIEQLSRVEGIGAATIEEITPYVTVSGN